MSDDFDILHKATVYEGFIKLARYQIRHASFRGGWCEPVLRERLENLAGISVLAYDPRRDEVVLIEQFRSGALEDPRGPWMLETIGGFRDRDEDSLDVVHRELHEEANLRALQLEHVGGIYVSPGFSSERIELYCARVDASAAGGIHGLPEEGEETRVVVLPAQQAMADLFGRINSTSAVILLQWLASNRARLRRDWVGTAQSDNC